MISVTGSFFVKVFCQHVLATTKIRCPALLGACAHTVYHNRAPFIALLCTGMPNDYDWDVGYRRTQTTDSGLARPTQASHLSQLVHQHRRLVPGVFTYYCEGIAP